ncbi:MAG: hypothetical protein WDO13_13690 [Verrucomicrobiota bacterium]
METKAVAPPALPRRGFIYFCESSLTYNHGARAWLFFAPYLAGAIALESRLDWSDPAGSGLWPWVGLLAYIVIFPTFWRAVLLRLGIWRRKDEPHSASGAHSADGRQTASGSQAADGPGSARAARPQS